MVPDRRACSTNRAYHRLSPDLARFSSWFLIFPVFAFPRVPIRGEERWVGLVARAESYEILPFGAL